MKRSAVTAILLFGAAAPASAQVGGGIPVFDTSTYAQTLATVKNTLNMVQQGQQLYGSMNQLTNVNGIGSILNSSSVRNVLPPEARDIQKLMSGDVGSTGTIGNRATQILQAANLDTGGTTDTDQAASDAVQDAGRKSATNAAVAETAFTTTTQRTQGLEELRTSLDTAEDTKQVQDLQARISVEQAHIQNDQMQLQALAMRQAAQDRLSIESDDARSLRDTRASLGK